MSDHWKKLANLLGTPGPADPPETAAKSDAGDGPAAKKPEAVRPTPPPPAPAVTHTAPRKRSSMWGDDLETDAPAVDLGQPAAAEEQRVKPADLPTSRRHEPARSSQPTDRPAAARQPAERTPGEPRPSESVRGGRRRGDELGDKPAAVRPTDALEEMAIVKREPPVPGFDVPESRSPERPETPAKRSAWDTLISTLGIKPAAGPEEPRSRTEPPAPPKQTQQPIETGGYSGFGAGLLDTDDSFRGSEASASTAAFDKPAGEREIDEDRSRGRGRRGNGRHRDFEEPVRDPAAEIGWDPEPGRRDRGDELSGERSRRSEERAAGEGRPQAFGDDESGSEETRRRRPRRRGQRQLLALSETELDRPAREPAASRGQGDLGPARREESGGRDRGPRRDRGEEPRGERGSRPSRADEGRRGERASFRSEIEEPRLRDDDDSEGFGGDLLAEVAPPRSSEEESPSRPRRRRGRRGRGGAAARSEEVLRTDEPPRSEAEIEEEDPWAPVSAAPEFDDDYEDDEEAEQLRRRSRGGRGRGQRRDAAAGPRGETASSGLDEPARPERNVAVKQYSAPTWLETVTLLVDANIQRRGGASRGPQGGRGGRR